MATLSLNIDAKGATTGARQFKSATNDVKASASSTAVEVTRASAAIDRMGASAGAKRFVFQNTANQIGDIAVQASMGTNIFRVLGMQLPQVAGGFALLGGVLGTVAPVLGIVAAVGFPLIAMYTQMGSKTTQLSAATKLAAQTFDTLKSQTANLKNEIQLLNSEYSNTTQIVLANAITAQREEELRIGNEIVTMRENMETLSATGFAKAATREAEKIKASLKAIQLVRDEIELRETELEQNKIAIAELKNRSEAIKEEKEAAERLAKAQGEVRKTTREILMFGDGLENIVNISPAVQKSISDITKEIVRFGDGLEELPDPFEETRKSVASVTKDIMMFGDGLEDAFVEPEKKATSAAKKIGRTFSKELSPEVKRVVDLSESIGSSFEKSMMSAVEGTLSLKDAFRSLAADIISELYRVFVVKQITGFITQSVQQAFGVSQLDQGISLRPRARPDNISAVSAFGGPVNPSQGVVVGERGPEVFFPNSKGNIIPNKNLNNNVIVNQTINVTTGVQQTVRAEVLGLLPQISEASKAAVLDAKRRGGSFAGAF